MGLYDPCTLDERHNSGRSESSTMPVGSFAFLV
jgi:hypothetical protein